MKLGSWGNYLLTDADVFSPADANEIYDQLRNQISVTPRGNGKSYGDAALGKNVISILKLNRIISFDKASGIVECESGVLLIDILNHVVRHGWFLSVAPGTAYVTIGGAVSSDVHGKNHHHAGTFSNCILQMEMMLADGHIFSFNKQTAPDLFAAVCGGMGWLGLITKVTIQLKRIESVMMNTIQLKANSVGYLLELMQTHVASEYEVAWLNTKTGKGILFLGEHHSTKTSEATLSFEKQQQKTISPFIPSAILNSVSISMFNKWYQRKHADGEKKTQHFVPYFFPLDKYANWNRLYGEKGFLQYQFVVPLEKSEMAISRVIEKVNAFGLQSYLSTLKLFGEQQHLLSFPMKGFSLAMDLPCNEKTFKLFQALDQIVMLYGGRIFLAKDACISHETFETMYPTHKEFLEVKKKYDPEMKFRSLMFDRLFNLK